MKGFISLGVLGEEFHADNGQQDNNSSYPGMEVARGKLEGESMDERQRGKGGAQRLDL